MRESNVNLDHDHNQIVQTSAQLEILCKKIEKIDVANNNRLDRIEDKLDNFHSGCYAKQQDCNKTFVKNKTFWMVITGVFMLVVGAYSYAHILYMA